MIRWFYYVLSDGYCSGYITAKGALDSMIYEMSVRKQRQGSLFKQVGSERGNHDRLIATISLDQDMIDWSEK